uniref:Universal stress protein n=1 Tax=Roseihalotalea indica TaxID=2867963 RepID=A0AA49JB49_9BACT|nr:universal stress protein [Tunicatimonas sp. TK19036]
MHPVRKIMVGLDTTEMDTSLIQFASFLARTGSAENVHFVNVIKRTQLPSKLRQEFPDLLEKARVDRRRELEKKVIEHFDLTLPVKVKISVEEGTMPSKEILKLSEKYNIDAIVVGRKAQLKGSSVVTQRLARRATCSLLIVPEREYTTINKVMVATDFTKESVAALNEAVALARYEQAIGNPVELVCHHAYEVPVGYHYSGKSFEECGDVMLEHAKRKYDKFIKKVDTEGVKVTASFSLIKNEDAVSNIYETARDQQIDCIVIGGKGKSAPTALFPIGTTTEKLIGKDTEIPLLIVRPKHKNAGLIDMLQRI